MLESMRDIISKLVVNMIDYIPKNDPLATNCCYFRSIKEPRKTNIPCEKFQYPCSNISTGKQCEEVPGGFCQWNPFEKKCDAVKLGGPKYMYEPAPKCSSLNNDSCKITSSCIIENNECKLNKELINPTNSDLAFSYISVIKSDPSYATQIDCSGKKNKYGIELTNEQMAKLGAVPVNKPMSKSRIGFYIMLILTIITLIIVIIVGYELFRTKPREKSTTNKEKTIFILVSIAVLIVEIVLLFILYR